MRNNVYFSDENQLDYRFLRYVNVEKILDECFSDIYQCGELSFFRVIVNCRL